MKIMKKSFSFVCCLFLAVSCLTPSALADDPPIPEGMLFEFVNNCSAARLWVNDTVGDYPTGRSYAQGFKFRRVRGNYYKLVVGGNSYNVLDHIYGSQRVWVQPYHGGDNQLWEFISEKRYGSGRYRIRNVAMGDYLTFNPDTKMIFCSGYEESPWQWWAFLQRL